MLEKHHIIFKSQGGLDFELNYKHLTPKDHRGNNGPHLNRQTDLKYKKGLEVELNNLLDNDYYTLNALKYTLAINGKQIARAMKKITQYEKGYKREDIIRRLMGGRSYL